MKEKILSKLLLVGASFLLVFTPVSADTTFRLKQVTDASELTDGQYVFKERENVLKCSVNDNKGIDPITMFNTTGLVGDENYVWSLETVSNGFYIKAGSKYLNNVSSGTGSDDGITSNMNLGTSKVTKWEFVFTDGTAMIKNTKMDALKQKRMIANDPNFTYYKAYQDDPQWLDSYNYKFTIYKLVPEQYETVTITTAKFATYCSENVLDFSETDASVYIAKVTDGKVVLSEIADGIVPANTGVIIYKDVNKDEILNVLITEVNASVTDNELVGVTAETTVLWEEDGKYNYILQRDDGGVAKFFKAIGAKLVANRAYLSTTYDVSANAAHGLEIVFEDNTEVTGINASLMNNVQRINNVCYNLAGLRVAQPVKGLYIASGKKFVIK